MSIALKRRLLHLARAASLVLIALTLATFACSAVWTGGVSGRSGDLLLGVHPGQLRLGWSQDWRNQSSWVRFEVERSPRPMHLGFLGGNTFTSTPPHEVAIDLPLWFVLLATMIVAAILQRWIARLPRHPACRRCGYPKGESETCTECGASLAGRVS